MARAAAAWLLALLALLAAGCATPDPTSEDATKDPAEEDGNGDEGPCPPMPESRADAWQAPAWQVGDSWNYTVWREDEIEGWENQTVVGVGPFGLSACAYAVEVRSTSRYASDETHPEGGAMNTGVRHYDARTLNVLWEDSFDCSPPCPGQAPWPYDFPLRDGQGWDYVSGGDTPVTMHGYALLTGAKSNLTLDVHHSEDPGVFTSTVHKEIYHYSPLVGNAVAWERLMTGDVTEHKVLDDYRYQAAEGLVF